ncbi:MAG TPA: methyltransferase domain-containing protein [Terriglobia bacterium]|nr:methyltransferase domain-containing protein [Terriglobia bacterium]
MADSPYKLLAVYYDRLFEPIRAPMGRVRQQVLADILRRAEVACDLACGTGTTAVELARRGIRMYAVDASAAMCRLARQKARDAGTRLTVLHGDMRSFRLPETVDLVTCEFDAVNHVPRKSDLDRVTRAVARALRPGGWFFFDVNNRLAFEKVWTGTWRHELPGVVLVMHGGYDGRRQKGWSNAEWFIRKGKNWRRFCERVEEVAWTPAEIRKSLRRAGFTTIQSWDQAPFVREWKISPGYRTLYLARKAGARSQKHELRRTKTRAGGANL